MISVEDHEVYAWGNNSMAQCGLGHCTTPVCVPRKVPELDGIKIEQLCAGTTHSVVWTSQPLDRSVLVLNDSLNLSVLNLYKKESGH